MSEAQKIYSFNKEDLLKLSNSKINIDENLKFKEARKAKLQKLNIESTIESTIYGLVFPAPAQGQAAEAAEVAAPANGAQAPKYIITFTGTNNNDININTEVIKTIVQAQKDVQPANAFKGELKTIIEQLTKENKTADLTANTPLEDGKNAAGKEVNGIKTIILEAYVHQNVIKILTIVYAYFVLIEKINVIQTTPQNPEPNPLPVIPPLKPEYDDDVLKPFFGNLFDPFMDGTTNLVDEIEKFPEILTAILSGDKIKDSIPPALEYLNTGIVVSVNNVVGKGYNAALTDNMYSLCGPNNEGGALANIDKMTPNIEARGRALAGLLRKMQYYRARKAIQGSPEKPTPGVINAANNDLLKFVLDTFPLFTKMSTDDVDIVNGVQLGGKILKKKH